MNKNLGLVLMPYMAAMPFADLVGGISKTIETGSRAEGAQRMRRFPATYQLPDASIYKPAPNSYRDLTPNESFKSIQFIESIDCKILNREKGFVNSRSTLRIIGWLNTRKLVGIDETDAVIQLMLSLPEGPFNAAGLSKIRIDSTKILDDRIFSRYTFEESARQYLMLPFAAFALEIEVAFSFYPNAKPCI